MRAARCLAIALAAVASMAPGVRALAAPASAPSERSDDPSRAAIARAREAARAADYEEALRHYEEALRLEPSAKLHFNVAVCHHRLMMEHPAGSPEHEERRAAAVAAYNRYLQAAPGASDADEVAELVRALGGTPLSAQDPEPWTIELVEPDAVPDPPNLHDAGTQGDAGAQSDPKAAPTGDPPAPVTPTAPVLRGRVGGFLPVVSVDPGQLSRSDELRPLPALGLGLRGNAFLGQRRRIALGGELALGTQPASARTRHRLGLGWIGVLLEVRHPLGPPGKRRFEIGGGGVVGVGWQTLVYTGPSRLRCANGREASQRGGLWSGARLWLAALLGPRRNHELSLRVGPGLAAYAAGSVPAKADAAGTTCEGEPSAFETFGLRDGAALSVTVDIGYAPRF